MKRALQCLVVISGFVFVTGCSDNVTGCSDNKNQVADQPVKNIEKIEDSNAVPDVKNFDKPEIIEGWRDETKYISRAHQELEALNKTLNDFEIEPIITGQKKDMEMSALLLLPKLDKNSVSSGLSFYGYSQHDVYYYDGFIPKRALEVIERLKFYCKDVELSVWHLKNDFGKIVLSFLMFDSPKFHRTEKYLLAIWDIPDSPDTVALGKKQLEELVLKLQKPELETPEK